MFEELLIKPEEFTFVRKKSPVHTWINFSKDFEIIQTVNSTNSTYDINWYSTIVDDIFSPEEMDKKLDNMTIDVFASFNTLKEAKMHAYQEIKSVVPKDKYQQMDLRMKRFSVDFFTMHAPTYYVSPAPTFEIQGKAITGWHHNADINWLISPKTTFKTRPQLIQYLYKIAVQNLDSLFQQEIYTKTKQTISSADSKSLEIDIETLFQKDNTWWVSFVKPEIDLTTIF